MKTKIAKRVLRISTLVLFFWSESNRFKVEAPPLPYRTSNQVLLTSVPNDATVCVGGNLRFVCNAAHFVGRIVSMRLFITSFFESIAIKITDWRHGIGTYLYTNISLHPDGNKVSCVITDNLGMNYMSKAISISVEESITSVSFDTTYLTTPETSSAMVTPEISSTMVTPRIIPNTKGTDDNVESTRMTDRAGVNTTIIIIAVVLGVVAIVLVMVCLAIACIMAEVVSCSQKIQIIAKRICSGFKETLVLVPDVPRAIKNDEDDQARVGTEKFATSEEEEAGVKKTDTLPPKLVLPRYLPPAALHRGSPAQLEADLSPAASVGNQADLDKERIDKAAERSSAGDEFEDMEDGGKGSNDITELDGKAGMEFGDEDPVIKQCEDPREHQPTSCIPGSADEIVVVTSSRPLGRGSGSVADFKQLESPEACGCQEWLFSTL